ncbi:MAG: hypothetical protein KAI81_05335 [Candidatus Marinimicrobia bacterium]|nr:hypothetical protein [Candidatus Neomarinimicrobiota bacterium]
MATKLTLSMDGQVIHNTKLWAQQHGISLSKIVENYFNSLTNSNNNNTKIAPKTNNMIGFFHSEDKNLSYRELIEKYKGSK